MGNYNIQCDIAMNDEEDEGSVTVRELGCGVGPKLLCQPSHVLTEWGYTPTSKKSRRHFLEVAAPLLRSLGGTSRSTSLSDDLEFRIVFGFGIRFLPKI